MKIYPGNDSPTLPAPLRRALFVLFLATLPAGGCVNPQFPKDAHIEKASVRVTTPWGGYEMQVEQLDTGNAARNSTVPKK